MVSAGRNPHSVDVRAPLARPEIVNLAECPPSYNSLDTSQPYHDLPRLKCPKYANVANTIILTLISYLVYAETYWGEKLLERQPVDSLVTAQCQKPLDMVYKEILYGTPDSCPFRNNLTAGLQLNVCTPFDHRVLIDIRLFHNGLPTNEGVLLDPIDFTYMISNLKPKILDQLRQLLQNGH